MRGKRGAFSRKQHLQCITLVAPHVDALGYFKAPRGLLPVMYVPGITGDGYCRTQTTK